MRASGSQTARQKAAVIKAARLEKEKQIMAALLAGLEALEERSQAEKKLALAVSRMLDLGEAKSLHRKGPGAFIIRDEETRVTARFQ